MEDYIESRGFRNLEFRWLKVIQKGKLFFRIVD